MRTIMGAAVAKFGGDAFPTPDQKLLQGVQVQVPDLSGRSPAEAKSIIEGLGLNYADGGPRDSVRPAGTVDGTDPGAGAAVSKGTVITVYTSNGSLVALPNVVGMKVSDAQNALRGFAVQVTGGAKPDDIVKTMDPAAGTGAKPGAKVTLTVVQTAPTPPTGAPKP
jgi:hypothetical protein